MKWNARVLMVAYAERQNNGVMIKVAYALVYALTKTVSTMKSIAPVNETLVTDVQFLRAAFQNT